MSDIRWFGVSDTPSEHRTVGSHRAWCHKCLQWCYPKNTLHCPCCMEASGMRQVWVSDDAPRVWWCGLNEMAWGSAEPNYCADDHDPYDPMSKWRCGSRRLVPVEVPDDA